MIQTNREKAEVLIEIKHSIAAMEALVLEVVAHGEEGKEPVVLAAIEESDKLLAELESF